MKDPMIMMMCSFSQRDSEVFTAIVFFLYILFVAMVYNYNMYTTSVFTVSKKKKKMSNLGETKTPHSVVLSKHQYDFFYLLP